MCEGHAGKGVVVSPLWAGFQGCDHHMSGLPQQGLDLTFDDFHLEWAKAHIFSQDDRLIHSCFYWGSIHPSLLALMDVTSFIRNSNSSTPPGEHCPRHRQSVYLSQMTFIILNSVQVPITSRTCLENLDFSGKMRNTTSSLYPVISLTCTWRMMKPRGLVSHPQNQPGSAGDPLSTPVAVRRTCVDAQMLV